MNRTSICVFGMQTGGELLSRIRYQEGHVAVSDWLADRLADMSLPEAAKLLAETLPQYKFVDVLPAMYATPPTADTDGTYVAEFVSLVQPASYVTVTLPGPQINEFTHMMSQSGMYELLTLKPA